MPTVDEILAALPQVGFRLWILADNGTGGWYAVVCEDKNPATQFHGNGATAVDALARALEDAGVKVDA
jgi:hypothetical protein